MSTDTTSAPTAPPDPQPGPAAGTNRSRRRLVVLGLVVLAALPGLGGIVGLLLNWSPFLPFGDQAVLELSVRKVGEDPVLLGAYSRFGWYHPGPLAAYLLAVPYRLLGEAHQALSLGALVIAAVTAVCCVLLVRRRAGDATALFTVVVLAVSVRLLGADFLRDSWNPYLPVLPLLLTALLCWSALAGDRWALPLATLPASLAVQSHIGFLPPVGMLAAVTLTGLAVGAVRHRRRPPLLPALATVVLPLVLWLPPLIQQLTGEPGNAGAVLRYLRSSNPDSSISTGLRGVADEFGKLPSYLVGTSAPERLLLPEMFPPWAIAVGLLLFAAAVAVGVARRRAEVLWLVALTGAVAVAAVAAVSRIDGPPFFYVTRWTVVIGMLAWITVGVALVPELAKLLERRPRPGRVAVAAPVALLAVLAVAASTVTAVGTARAETPQTDYSGDISRFERAVIADLAATGTPRNSVVRVDFAPTTRQIIVGTSFPGSGLVLGLVRDGVDVQVSTFWQLPFGADRSARVDQARYLVTLAYSDGSSPPPAPGQRVLAVAGEYQVYGGTVPPVSLG